MKSRGLSDSLKVLPLLGALAGGCDTPLEATVPEGAVQCSSMP